MRALSLLLLSALVACATVEGLRDDPPNAGQGRLYRGAEFEDVARAARWAVAASGLKLEDFEEITPTHHIILASAGSGMFTWGERVRVLVDGEARAPDVTVYVHTKRKMATTVAGKGDWSPEIFEALEAELSDVGEDIVPPCTVERWAAGDCDDRDQFDTIGALPAGTGGVEAMYRTAAPKPEGPSAE